MNRPFHLPRPILALGIPFVLISVIVWLATSAAFERHADALSVGITADLLLLVPLIYLLLIRKTSIPKTTVVPVLVLGVVVASMILPKEQQGYLELFKTWFLPLLELFVVGFVVYKVRKAIRHYRTHQQNKPDFFSALKEACAEVVPRPVVMPLATEIAVIYYGLFHWQKKQPASHEFTYHRRSGTGALLAGFILIIAIETFVLHLLLAQWNVVVAWVLTGLSVYTALQVLAFAKTLSRRFIAVKSDILVLRYGILSESTVPLRNISSVSFSRKPLIKGDGTRKLCPFGSLESHNVVIALKNEGTLTGLYGKQKTYQRLALHVDDPARFKEALETSLSLQ